MKNMVCLLLLTCLLMSAAVLIEPSEATWDIPYRWYAGAEIPQVIYPETSPPTDTPVPLLEARANVEVKQNTVVFGGFVGFFLYIGNPSTEEWLAVGFYQNRTGYYWYSDKQVKWQYAKLIYGYAAVGENRTLKVTSSGTAYIDDIPVDYVIFTQTTTPFYYGVRSESNNPYNSLKGNYFELKIGLWEYDSHDIRGAGWIYVLKSWFFDYCVLWADTPYHVQGITGSGLKQVLTSGHKRMFRPGRGGGGRCRLE